MRPWPRQINGWDQVFSSLVEVIGQLSFLGIPNDSISPFQQGSFSTRYWKWSTGLHGKWLISPRAPPATVSSYYRMQYYIWRLTTSRFMSQSMWNCYKTRFESTWIVSRWHAIQCDLEMVGKWVHRLQRISFNIFWAYGCFICSTRYHARNPRVISWQALLCSSALSLSTFLSMSNTRLHV
jgi:hypothetical protein